MPVISINRPMVIILLSHHTSFRKMQHLELSFMLLYIVLAPIKHDASAVCSTMRGLSFKLGQHIKQIQSIVQLISSLTATGIIMNTSSLIPVCSINKYRSCIFKGQPSDSNHYIFPSHLPLCPCPPSWCAARWTRPPWARWPHQTEGSSSQAAGSGRGSEWRQSKWGIFQVSDTFSKPLGVRVPWPHPC